MESEVPPDGSQLLQLLAQLFPQPEGGPQVTWSSLQLALMGLLQ